MTQEGARKTTIVVRTSGELDGNVEVSAISIRALIATGKEVEDGVGRRAICFGRADAEGAARGRSRKGGDGPDEISTLRGAFYGQHVAIAVRLREMVYKVRLHRHFVTRLSGTVFKAVVTPSADNGSSERNGNGLLVQRILDSFASRQTRRSGSYSGGPAVITDGTGRRCLDSRFTISDVRELAVARGTRCPEDLISKEKVILDPRGYYDEN